MTQITPFNHPSCRRCLNRFRCPCHLITYEFFKQDPKTFWDRGMDAIDDWVDTEGCEFIYYITDPAIAAAWGLNISWRLIRGGLMWPEQKGKKYE